MTANVGGCSLHLVVIDGAVALNCFGCGSVYVLGSDPPLWEVIDAAKAHENAARIGGST